MKLFRYSGEGSFDLPRLQAGVQVSCCGRDFSQTSKKLPQQKRLQPAVVLQPRRQHHHPAEAARVPIEIGLVMLADQRDHFAHNRLLHITARAGINFDQFIFAALAVGSPATE